MTQLPISPTPKQQSITLSLPVDILKRAQLVAARRKTSLSQLVTKLLEESLEEDEYQLAMAQHFTLMEQPEGLGVVGEVTWTRDELHER